MCNVSFLPCGITGCFPTLTTYEWTVLSVATENKCTLPQAAKILIPQLNSLTGNSKFTVSGFMD